MVKIYYSKDKNEMYGDRKRKKKKFILEEINTKKKYLDIWDINPSFKDINNTISIIKLVLLFLIALAIVISSYLLFKQLLSSMAFGILCIIMFMSAFHDEFHWLRYFFQFSFGSKISLDPFRDFVFWHEQEMPKTLYISNKRDLIHIALQIYQIIVIPENIHSAIEQFVKALSSKEIKLSYSYQIIQKPIIPLFQEKVSRNIVLKSLHSREASIYFMVFYREKGILTQNKIDRIKYYIKKNSNNLKSNLVSNFHHFQAKILSGDALVNAIRTFFVKKHIPNKENIPKDNSLKNKNNANIFRKTLVVCLLLAYFDIVLFTIKLFIGYILLLNFALSLLFIFIWWRAVLFQITKRKLLHTTRCKVVSPFKDVAFYYVKKFPHSLFLHINHHLLIGLKMVNLKYIYKNPFCLFSKFIESINNHKICFSYTLRNGALSYYDVYNNGLNHMNEKQKNFILFSKYKRIKNETDAEEWLGYRYGMWYSFLTMSVNTYRFITDIDNTVFMELEDELVTQIDVLKGAFNINFQGYKLEDMKSSSLISGLIFSCFKYNRFRLNGSHLNYVMMQGTTLHSLTTIVDILKKGTTTEIAAEFNTPLYLENFITIGHTINTEVWESEVPVGFTFDQIKRLLIMNGDAEKRELICMKIVAELIKTQVSSLIFDFSGNWSKLIAYYKNTRFENDILHFKYGSAFIIDPIKSDIPYDKNNTEYLNYMLYAFSLALKKDERSIEMFRNILRRYPDEDLPAICMSLQNQNDWEKSPISDSLLSLFSDFSQEDLSFFQTAQRDGIVANDFIRNNKTVIVDLSDIKELNKKLYLTFVILAKIIHYINHEGDYYEKCIIVPNVDNFFDSFYLDIKRNYDKVDLFLKPLIDNNFGLIFSVNQAHYLHANFLLYFNNFITLKATDNRDVSMLRNVMNLQELEGVGYYTTTRNQTYQLPYLRNLKDNKVIIRRDDINQPFPAFIRWEELYNKHPLLYEEIVRHMRVEGYDLQFRERKILEHAKKTLFEIDLGHYYVYVKEVIQFLDAIKMIDQVGNLYNEKLKKQLMELIYPKLSKRTNKKEHIKRVRDGLLEILIKQGYLVENHPRQASGSQTLRTSFSVGERYQQALNDYFEIRGKAQTDINVEIMEKAAKYTQDLTEIFKVPQSPIPSRKYIIQKENVREALIREFSDLTYDMFKMYSYINHKQYAQALKIGQDLIGQFLTHVYRQYNNMNKEITAHDFTKFLEFLITVEKFPFTLPELHNYIEKYKVIDIHSGEPLTKELYQFIYNFFTRIQNYIYEEYNNHGTSK